MAMTEDALLDDIIFTIGDASEKNSIKDIVEYKVEEFDFDDRFDMEFERDDFGF